MRRFPEIVLLNAARHALQVKGCGETVLAHVPLPPEEVETLVREVPTLAE